MKKSIFIVTSLLCTFIAQSIASTTERLTGEKSQELGSSTVLSQAEQTLEKSATGPTQTVAPPSNFSPVSNIMSQFIAMTSRSQGVLKAATGNVWSFELLNRTDVLEYTNSAIGVGNLTGSVINFDAQGGFDPVSEPIKLEDGTVIPGIWGKNVTMTLHERGRVYTRSGPTGPGIVSFIPLSLLPYFIGVGSTIRFQSGSWVSIGDRSYRNGGFTVLREGIRFLPKTEISSEIGSFQYQDGQWRQVLTK